MNDVATIRDLAANNAVTFGGDCVLSMGGRGVYGADVLCALRNAVSVDDRGSYVLVTGPTVDGDDLVVVAVVTDHIAVINVVV